MLSNEEIELLRKELETAKNPLFLYDADGDGLASFLLLYRKYKKGQGHIVKATNKISVNQYRKVKEYEPDKIFVLDIPLMDQEFVDLANRPIFWIDHHHPQKVEHVHYFNPQIKEQGIYLPTTRMVYQVVDSLEDLWIAIIGCLADWYLPVDLVPIFMEQYPDFVIKKIDLVHLIYYSKLEELVKMLFFFLKGKTSDVHQCIKVLTRIKSPLEILNQETSQGKFLHKSFSDFNHNYQILLKQAKKSIGRKRLFIFNYNEHKFSFTTELSNELSARYPQKVLIICRKINGEYKCSVRAKITINKALEKALVGIDGYGGGHPQACGAVIKEQDWEKFIENFERELKDVK